MTLKSFIKYIKRFTQLRESVLDIYAGNSKMFSAEENYVSVKILHERIQIGSSTLSETVCRVDCMIEKWGILWKENIYNRLIFISTRTNYSFPVEEGRV